MRIDVWSDFACPWCWLGKAHLEEALRRAGVEAEVTLRSFELQPAAGPTMLVVDYLLPRFGSFERIAEAHDRLAAMGEKAGLGYDFSGAKMANTFDAHRLHHFARTRGRAHELAGRLFRAAHGEGADLADHATLVRLATEAGLDAAEVGDLLASDRHAGDVRAEEAAARRIGVGGVPFFVFDGRFALSGAQPVEAFAQAIQHATRAPS